MDSAFLSNEGTSRQERKDFSSSGIPTWRLPLSKTYASGFKNFLYNQDNLSSEPEKVETTPEDKSPQKDPFDRNNLNIEESAQTVIQILLPCIICNRTFSPEALERHSKICTRVRAKDQRQSRPTFDSAVQRIKDTKMADFIPPPPEYPEQESCFTRGGRGRSSFQGSPTRTSFGKGSNSAAPWRRQRASSTPKTFFNNNDNYGVDPGSPEEQDYDDRVSNVGSNVGADLPSYARALSPSEDCPYCLRNFGLKAYDRHVSFCREIWERKQYEVQPTPAEIHEARERQDIRTKYKPMKGSNSCSSLRSGSPPKDRGFASAALNKLFGGLKRTENRTLFRTPDRMKKSNESLSSSCYGDFARGGSMRRYPTSPAIRPTELRIGGFTGKGNPMQVNTTSNVHKKTKSTDNLLMNSINSTVPSSGYGPGGSYLNNFSRNSKTRASLNSNNNNYNFFRSKRVEPEGTENTNAPNSTLNPLIITPMSFYSKHKSDPNDDSNGHDHQTKSTLFSASDPKYDPYEKAAKQLEELLKTQPMLQKSTKSNRTQRRIGLDRAFASVNPSVSMPSPDSFEKNSGFKPKPPAVDPPRLNRFSGQNESSYWEEILDKKSRSRDERDSNRDHRDSIQLSDSSEQTSSSAGSGNENQQKSRAVSNISSADSAYSRSDGIDLEFEALESLVTKSLGNVPLSTTPNPNTAQLGRESPPKSSDLMSSRNPPMMMTSFVSNPIPPPHQLKDSNVGGLTPTGAKFCHECGTSYPTAAAKFCPECGERRVINI